MVTWRCPGFEYEYLLLYIGMGGQAAGVLCLCELEL